MCDFTLSVYKNLLQTLIEQQYHFQTVEQFVLSPLSKVAVLRHDVDRLPAHSLNMAVIEHQLGVQGTYYFRSCNESFHPDIIRKIVALNHEIGYHYEDLASMHGNYETAINSFIQNLAKLRQYYPVKTICMHGSPLSKYDNRKIWKLYNYHDFGIIAEPYLDFNFNKIMYLTDTGRGWNKSNASIRDKIEGQHYLQGIKNTAHLIFMIKENILSQQLLFTLHPQRWTNNAYDWFRELIFQNIKNIIKGVVVRRSNP